MRTPGRDPAGTGEEGHLILNAFHRMCLERDVVVRFPPDVPIHICELMATLGVTVEADASMAPYREVLAGRNKT